MEEKQATEVTVLYREADKKALVEVSIGQYYAIPSNVSTYIGTMQAFLTSHPEYTYDDNDEFEHK